MGKAYVTPLFSAGDPLVCHTLEMRPSLWAVVFDCVEMLGEAWSWRQDDGTHATVSEVNKEMRAALDSSVYLGCLMIGEIKELVLDTVPAWLLPCDGATYADDDWPLLGAAIHANLRVDAGHFRTPDRNRRIGWGEAVGAQEGSEMHTNTEAELVPHTHSEQDPGAVLIVPGVSIEYALADPGLPSQTGSTGDGEAYSVLNPVEGAQFYIVATYPGA